ENVLPVSSFSPLVISSFVPLMAAEPLYVSVAAEPAKPALKSRTAPASKTRDSSTSAGSSGCQRPRRRRRLLRNLIVFNQARQMSIIVWLKLDLRDTGGANQCVYKS